MSFDDHVTITVFMCMISFGVASIYFVSRLDLENSHFHEIAQCLSLSCILSTSGTVWAVVSQKVGFKRRIPYSAALLSALTVAILFGMIKRVTSFDASPCVMLTGILSLTLTFRIWWKRRNLKTSLLFLLLVQVFSMWVGFSVYGSGYQTPLFREILLVGEPPIDTLFHVSVANMLNTHGIPSTGLDGVPFLPYHFGSHWLFMQLSRFLDMDLLLFYNIGFPIIFVPLLLGSILMFALSYRSAFTENSESRSRLGSNYIFWIIIMVANTGFVPSKLHGGISHLISESYAVGLTAVFVFSSMMMSLYKTLESENMGRSYRLGIILLITIPSMLGIVGLCKVSLMILSFILIAYLSVRLNIIDGKIRLALAAFSLLVVIMMFRITIAPGAPGLSIEPFHYLRNYVPGEWWPYFLFLELAWSWLFICFRLLEENIKTLGSLWDSIVSRRIIDVECVFVISVVGSLPGLLLAIPGGSASYFSDFQRWLSVGLILACYPRVRNVLIGSLPGKSICC